jgi:carboxyl-terminal processing protease
MSPRARRAVFSLVVFFAACAFMGTVLQRRVGAQSAEDESQIRDNLKDFTNVYAIVEQNYAEPITGDKADTAIYDGAIPGMLHTLDPHSSFYDPKAYAKMREDERGHYFGVGMVIQQQRNLKTGKDQVVVIDPYAGAPAFRAGIHPADVIVSVNGQPVQLGSTDPNALNSSDSVANHLKGPKGTHVQVSMIREGQSKPMVFDLVRDEIPHGSVDLKYEIRPGIGYIHLTMFMETSAQDIEDAINGFGNLKGLVLDLRGNPGGMVSQAVEICDHLLAKGQTIVTQRGRAFPDQNYVATHGNDGKTFPIIVLVNRNTASAAEIVSGALQDHDRALIVGETTFGKGLVQTVYNLSEDTGLALTTYHYYTPSGRLIQRNYNGVSLLDYYYNRAGVANGANREVRMTDSGRTVYGGGGITPDEKIETPKSNNFQDDVLYHDIFFQYAPHFFAAHASVDQNFQVTDPVMSDFKQFLTEQGVQWTDKDIADNADWLKVNIQSTILTTQFGKGAGLHALADWDPMIQKALTYMPEAQALEDHATKLLAEKAQAHNDASPSPAVQ